MNAATALQIADWLGDLLRDARHAVVDTRDLLTMRRDEPLPPELEAMYHQEIALNRLTQAIILLGIRPDA